jgi:alpha-D-ribose 1-methylphosphonate 5-triphosphate synthase subunit PhnG
LHTYIDQLQAKLNAIGDALFQTYILQAFQAQSDDEIRQQEEQQQQSRVASAHRPPSLSL